MIYLFFGGVCSGKTFFAKHLNIKNKIILDEAGTIDFSNYRFLNQNNYILIVQSIYSLNVSVMDKVDEIVHFHYDKKYGFVHSQTALSLVEND